MDNSSHINGAPGSKVLISVLLSFIIVLPDCSIFKPKVIERTIKEIEYRDREVHDTAYFTIPQFIEKNVTTDTSSVLENPYARSEAIVEHGLLRHSLESIPQVIPVPVTVHVTDTIYKESEVITEIQEVEKKLSWWQKARIDSFWWLLLGLLGFAGWAFRKPLLGLIKMII